MSLHWETATDDELVLHCMRSNPNRVVISEFDGGLSIIKLGDAVIKCGYGVSEYESMNQKHAYNILSSTIVRVPKVYRYFSHELRGYLIMEHIPGQPLSLVPNPEIYLTSVAILLRTFEGIHRANPGPLHDGDAVGKFWLDDDTVSLNTISDVECYFNERQLRDLTPLKLVGYSSVLCHLDLAPRNIIVMDDHSLCLLDWSSAGFYPRVFERAALDLNIKTDNVWNTQLLQHLDELEPEEISQVQLLKKAYYRSQGHVI